MMENFYPSLLKTAAAGLKRVFEDGQHAGPVLKSCWLPIAALVPETGN